MKVRVFLNRETDEDGRTAIFCRFGAGEGVYREGDALELVYEYDDADADAELARGVTVDVLNRAFAKFNRGSDTFVGNDEYPERSLSAGDVIEVGGALVYSVEGVGFVYRGTSSAVTAWTA